MSPLSESAKQQGTYSERRAVAALREALKDDPRGLRVRIKQEGALEGLASARRETESVIAGHNAAVDIMEADTRQLLALFQSKLTSPREEAGEAGARESARVWASLVPEAGTVAVGKKAKDSRAAATRIEIETELDVAEGLLSKTTGALALALVQEIGAIRAALYSPREVPDGLWPRTRNVAKGALAALASGEQDTDSRAQDAKRLDALITELLANDKDVKEFRELFRDSASTEKSIVDEWHARLSEIRRAGGSAGRLRGLYNKHKQMDWREREERDPEAKTEHTGELRERRTRRRVPCRAL